MLGAIGAGASEVWPVARLLARADRAGRRRRSAQGQHAVPRLRRQGARRHADRCRRQGRAFRSPISKAVCSAASLAASGSLAPRGNGAELAARADLKGGKLEDFSKSVTGSALAKGPFDLAFNVQGEGLSPPGVVAGLSGEGDALAGRRRPPVAVRRRRCAASPRPPPRRPSRPTRKRSRRKRRACARRSPRASINIRARPNSPSTSRTARFASLRRRCERRRRDQDQRLVELASLKLDSEWAMSLTGAAEGRAAGEPRLHRRALQGAARSRPAIDTARSRPISPCGACRRTSNVWRRST